MDFVDDQRRRGRQRREVLRAGRAVDLAAAGPTGREAVVEGDGQQRQCLVLLVGGNRPGRVVGVGHGIDRAAVTMAQDNRLAAVAQLLVVGAAPRPVEEVVSVEGAEERVGAVGGDDDELAWVDDRVGREGEADGADGVAAQVGGRRPGVVKLDELLVRLVGALRQGAIVDLVDDDVGQRRGRRFVAKDGRARHRPAQGDGDDRVGATRLLPMAEVLPVGGQRLQGDGQTDEVGAAVAAVDGQAGDRHLPRAGDLDRQVGRAIAA